MSAAEDSPASSSNGPEAFPQYRATVDGRHFYRIDGPRAFVEVQVVGKRRWVHRVEAKAYPEMLRIQEMLSGGEGRYRTLSEQEWMAVEGPPG